MLLHRTDPPHNRRYRLKSHPTPVQFTSYQQISTRPLTSNNPQVELYLTRAEFDDVASRFCNQNAKHGEHFLPSAEALQYIWEFSNGQPGGVRALLDILVHSPVRNEIPNYLIF